MLVWQSLATHFFGFVLDVRPIQLSGSRLKGAPPRPTPSKGTSRPARYALIVQPSGIEILPPRPSLKTTSMKPLSLLAAFAALFGNITFCSAQSTTSAAGACPTVLTPSYEAPVVGSGWTAQLIATDLKTPRSITFDQNGALLVVQQGSGIVRLTLTDNGGTCLAVNKTSTVVENSDVGVFFEVMRVRTKLLITSPCLAESCCSTVR